MAIGKTKADEIIKRGLMLSEAEAWLNAFDSATKKEILDWIRIKQLQDEGTDKNDKIIGFYSATTELLTNGRKRMGEPYDLNDTGDFYRSMFISVMQDRLVIDANSSTYTEMQKQRWFRNEILGLNEENLQLLIQKVKEKYLEYVRRTLFGN